MLSVPRRGLRIRYWFGRVGVWTILFALTAGAAFGAWWAFSGIADVRREQQIWARGRDATDVSVRGRVQSKGLGWVMAHYELTVDYRADGQRHHRDVDFTTAFGSVDRDRAPAVRFDPDAPDRIALNWAVDASGARWRWAIGGGAIFLLITAAVLYGLVAVIGDSRALRRTAMTGAVAVADIVSTTPGRDRNGRPDGKLTVRLSLPAPDDGEPRTWLDEVPVAKAQPLYADRAHTTAFVLVGAAGEPMLLLRDDLYPLATSATERADVLTQAQAHAAPPTA